MPVRRQVQRHPVEKRREVCAVVEVEAAQKILVRFPAARVLRDDDPGNGFQDFTRAHGRSQTQLLRAHRAHRRRIGDANQTVGTAKDDDVRQRRGLGGSQLLRGGVRYLCLRHSTRQKCHREHDGARAEQSGGMQQCRRRQEREPERHQTGATGHFRAVRKTMEKRKAANYDEAQCQR